MSTTKKPSGLSALAIAVLAALASYAAAADPIVSPGTPTTTVPASLFDPLSSLTSPLPAGEFLLPINVSGANGLQDWSFDLNFNDGVVNPLDVGGLFQSVYQAQFSASDPTLSNVTSSGVLFPGSPQDTLQGIAGFSSAVSGDGLLAYILFQRLVPDANPGFSISGVTVNQTPEPATLVLVASGLALLGRRRLIWRAQRS
jgi:hypothetical protein